MIRQDSMMAGRDSRVWLRIFERTGQCCALNFMRPGQGMHNSVSLTIACSRRSRLSRRLLAQAPRQPSSLLKLVLGKSQGDTKMRRLLGAALTAGWLVPLAFGADCLLSFIEQDLPLLSQGKVPYNSFPMMGAARTSALLAFSWLALVILYWAFRWLKHER